MSTMRWVEAVAGVALVLAVFYDLFQSVVLPRPAINKFALVRYLFRAVWRTWRWVGSRMSRLARREAWLASFAPVGVALNFTVWGLALVLGYGLIIDGLRGAMRPPPPDFGTSLYFSATTFVPLSYGDIVPIGVIARLATVAESVTGIIVAALAITLLFSLYESFQDREKLVVQLDALAGAPPSGVQILETASEHGMKDELIKTFDEWRDWSADVLESHLAYPILFYFRSSHDNEAWINSFGAVMDAAVLVMSTVVDNSEGPAKLMLTVGNHLVEDVTWYFRFPHPEDPIVERQEFDEARERLKTAGYQLQPADAAWEKFARLRKKYATPLNLLARNFAIVPAQWIGDRSYLPHRERTLRRARAASGRRQPPAR
jgi:Ion channel